MSRPVGVRYTAAGGWAWLCRICDHGDHGYLYSDDATYSGVYHLRNAHQAGQCA